MRSRPRIRAALAAMAALSAVAALGATVSACGVGPRHTIDAASAARRIASQLAARYPGGQPAVSCPAGVKDAIGETFVCTAVIVGQRVDLDAKVTSASGAFSVTPRSAIIDVAAATTQLTSEIAGLTGHPATVDCGARKVLVVAIGATFVCTSTFAGEAPRSVVVTATDTKGDFDFSLAPVPAQ